VSAEQAPFNPLYFYVMTSNCPNCFSSFLACTQAMRSQPAVADGGSLALEADRVHVTPPLC